MAPPNFQRRLLAVMRAGGLIKSDLRVWFNRPWATVRTWVEHGHEPTGPMGEVAYESLALLEAAVEDKRWFPIPRELSWLDRRRHVELARKDIDRAQIFPTRATK